MIRNQLLYATDNLFLAGKGYLFRTKVRYFLLFRYPADTSVWLFRRGLDVLSVG